MKKLCNYLTTDTRMGNKMGQDKYSSIPIVIIINTSILIRFVITYSFDLGVIKSNNDTAWKGIICILVVYSLSIILSVLLLKLRRCIQLFGLLIAIIEGVMLIELPIIFQTVNIILINTMMCSMIFVAILTDVSNKTIIGFVFMAVYYIYVGLSLCFRSTPDSKLYPLWIIILNLLYCFLEAMAIFNFCINAKIKSNTTIARLNQTLDSWKKMMQDMANPLIIMEGSSILYFNKRADEMLQSILDIDSFKAKICETNFNDRQPTITINDKKYTVAKDCVFFCEKPSIIFNFTNITTIIQKEEEKYSQRLVAAVTHELRGPLNVMQSIFEIIYPNVNNEQQSAIQKGLYACKMQESLINDILDVAKINDKKLVIFPIRSNLKETTINVIEMMKYRVSSSTVELCASISSTFPNYINIDERRYQQIIINLITNSIKFTKNGKITLALEYESLSLQCSVSDTGVGIPLQEQSVIFSLFGTTKSNSSMNTSGTGFGLYLCKNLIEAMNGRIKFRSTPNVLTTFEFSIPCTSSNAFASTETVALPNNIVVFHLDDDKYILYGLKEFAKRLGIKDYSYSNASDAIKEYTNGHFEFSIGFIDLNMPAMSGYEAGTKILNVNSKVKLIALTGEERESVKSKCYSSGFKDVAEKPLSFDNYKSLIVRHCGVGKKESVTVLNEI